MSLPVETPQQTLPPPPPLPMQMTPVYDPEDEVLDDEKRSAFSERIKEKMSNPGKLGLALGFVAVCVVVFIVVKSRSSKGETPKEEEEQPIEEQPNEELVAYEQQKFQVKDMYNKLMNHRTSLIEALSKIGQEASKNQEMFKQMFSTNKSSYDDDISGYEEEQSFDKAFMLKTDLDEKKQGMIKIGEELGKQHQAVVSELKETDTKISQALEFYNSHYDDPLADTRTLPPKQEQQQPHDPRQAAIEKAQRDYNKKSEFIQDGTGREMMPN